MEAYLLAFGILAPVVWLAARVYLDWRQAFALRKLTLSGVDELEGAAFEVLIVSLLRRDGFNVDHTGKPGDKGADILAGNYAIQCKRYGIPVGTAAVQEAVAAARYHWRQFPVVVTNAHFTKGAIELARGTGCILIGRTGLADWLQGRRLLR